MSESRLTPEMASQLLSEGCPPDLVEEFVGRLTFGRPVLPPFADAVMVLSVAPPLEMVDGRQIFREGSPENIARITRGVEDLREIAAKRWCSEAGNITSDDVHLSGVRLILNGVEQQLYRMTRIALEQGVCRDTIIEVDCGHRGEANTGSHFEAFRNNDRCDGITCIVIVTTDYHAARVLRTASMRLSSRERFVVDGESEFEYPILDTVRGEIRRIVEYAKRGEVVRNLSKPRFGDMCQYVGQRNLR